MSKSARILIVSAYGREHWLAVQLVRLGFDVQLIDVTHKLGVWKPEDYEAPFGIFISSVWTASYIDRLFQEEITEEASQGFVIWLKDGPVELRSTLTDYRLKALGQKENIMKYVQNHDGYSESQKKDTAQRLFNLGFEQKWFAQLSHYLMANRVVSVSDNTENIFNRPLICPLLDAFYIRNTNEQTLEKSLKWCEEQGVVVVRKGEIPDVAVRGSVIEGIEIQSEKSGFVRSQKFIWGLSSLETQYAFPKVYKKLFSHGMNPDYSWQRFRVKMADCRERSQLPISFLMIEALDFPWTHDNFAIIKKTNMAGEFDVWMMIPFSQRFQKKYLEDSISKVIACLHQRAPRLAPQLVSLPLEAIHNSQDLGGVLFPVFSKEQWENQAHKKFMNLYFDSPETWPIHSWQGSYYGQSYILDRISKWWSQLTPQKKEKELSL